MNISFSLEYSPNYYEETGYHTTLSIYKEEIIKNGFIPSCDEDDWLGEGVYFWDNIENARWWKNNGGTIRPCIFECKLKCDNVKMLNLDSEIEMNKFEKFSKKYINEMSKNSGKKPSFKNNNEKRKFFCDVYCSKNGYDMLSFTFEHDKINKIGFKIGIVKRRQICVRNQRCITILSVKE